MIYVYYIVAVCSKYRVNWYCESDTRDVQHSLEADLYSVVLLSLRDF